MYTTFLSASLQLKLMCTITSKLLDNIEYKYK